MQMVIKFVKWQKKQDGSEGGVPFSSATPDVVDGLPTHWIVPIWSTASASATTDDFTGVTESTTIVLDVSISTTSTRTTKDQDGTEYIRLLATSSSSDSMEAPVRVCEDDDEPVRTLQSFFMEMKEYGEKRDERQPRNQNTGWRTKREGDARKTTHNVT